MKQVFTVNADMSQCRSCAVPLYTVALAGTTLEGLTVVVKTLPTLRPPREVMCEVNVRLAVRAEKSYWEAYRSCNGGRVKQSGFGISMQPWLGGVQWARRRGRNLLRPRRWR